jgi:RNA polymerase sigma factor (sigma-70 family)
MQFAFVLSNCREAVLSEEITNLYVGNGLEPARIIERLVLVHGEKWLRFIQKMVQNREDAEDVLQESVLKMLVRDRCFQSQDQARMYLSRVICNTAIETYHLRRRHRVQYFPLQEQSLSCSNSLDATSIFPEHDEVYRARVLSILHAGLAQLPVKQYEALRLTIMDPAIESIRDAGSENDIPYSTLRHRKLQGLRRLRRFLHKALRSIPLGG